MVFVVGSKMMKGSPAAGFDIIHVGLELFNSFGSPSVSCTQCADIGIAVSISVIL